MFNATTEILEDDRVHKYVLWRNGAPIPYADVLDQWQHNQSFRTFFISLLADSPFTAFRWETPPVTFETIVRQFEFVLLNCPGFASRTTDRQAYRSYFIAAKEGIVVFENLGNDATLVVPSPRVLDSAYGHLAAFIRNAPDSQKHALWRIVGATMQQLVSDYPLWLNTAGGGIAWLHVRLDSRPKYYGFRPYKTER